MINIQLDKQCCQCEKEHQLCVMFLADHTTDEYLLVDIPCYVCSQCLSNALSAVVAAQMERYRNGNDIR